MLKSIYKKPPQSARGTLRRRTIIANHPRHCERSEAISGDYKE